MIKKEKQQAIVTLLITGLTFGILCLAAWFHTPNQISVSERRRLAQLPALTKDSVGKGNFMSGFERYSQDQFPFREAFRKLKTKALFSLYAGARVTILEIRGVKAIVQKIETNGEKE